MNLLYTNVTENHPVSASLQIGRISTANKKLVKQTWSITKGPNTSVKCRSNTWVKCCSRSLYVGLLVDGLSGNSYSGCNTSLISQIVCLI